MEANEQITQQVGRFIRKVAEKFPITDELSLITDIHVRARKQGNFWLMTMMTMKLLVLQ